jgi:PPM family protein phosphatase
VFKREISTSRNPKISKSVRIHFMNLTSIYYLHEIGGKKNQEDYIWPAAGTAVPENKIFIVCDGVGGSENGEIASRIIAEYTGKALLQTPPENISLAYINGLLADAKQNLITYARVQGLNKDMATTFTLLVLFSNTAFIAWCGDSRVYHIRNGEILYKTSDHSLVNTLVKKGEITEDEALLHPQKHIILKAITGDDSTAEADGEWINNIAGGDYFMLCTDGLLENITDADVKTLLTSRTTVQTDIVLAMQEKCFGKTRDNYSMYLLQVDLDTTTPLIQKTKKGYRAVWLALLALLVIAAVFLFFNKKDTTAMATPAPAVKADSLVVSPGNGIIKKDSILQPGKNSIPDSEPINKEEAEERKISPAPLPELKLVVDSSRQKKRLQKKADTIYASPQPLKNGPAAQKTDSSLKHGKPLN